MDLVMKKWIITFSSQKAIEINFKLKKATQKSFFPLRDHFEFLL